LLFGLDAHSASSQDNYVASTRRSAAPEPDLAVLLPSWELHLRAERKSPQTVKTYGDGVRRYLGYCTDQGLSTLDRTSLASFIASLLGAGAEPATARSRHLAVRRFATWLLEEGEIDHDPFVGLHPPKLDVRVVEPLSDDQLRALLKACAGTEFRDRRDEAVLRLMLETGSRAGEVVSMRQAPRGPQAGGRGLRLDGGVAGSARGCDQRRSLTSSCVVAPSGSSGLALLSRRGHRRVTVGRRIDVAQPDDRLLGVGPLLLATASADPIRVVLVVGRGDVPVVSQTAAQRAATALRLRHVRHGISPTTDLA